MDDIETLHRLARLEETQESLIDALRSMQQRFLELESRCAVDQNLLAAFILTHPDPQKLLAAWEEASSTVQTGWLVGRLQSETGGAEHEQQLTPVTTARIQFWQRQLQRVARTDE